MFKYIPKLLLLFLVILLLPLPASSKTIGELFTAEKADELFGEVLTSVNIESGVLKDLINKTGRY